MGALIARCVVQCVRVTLRRRAALKFQLLVNSGKLIDLMFFDGQVNTANCTGVKKTSVIRCFGQ